MMADTRHRPEYDPHEPTNPAREEALACAARGWPVIPLWWPATTGPGATCACGKPGCERVGKHPLSRNGDGAVKGAHSATTDPSVIRRWFTKWPMANYGLPMGGGRNAVDMDPRSGGDVTLRTLEAQHGALPETVETWTGGGGQHLHLLGDLPTCDIGDGLELKGAGSYVVGPGSLHASGVRYTWEAAGHPDDRLLATVPEWLCRIAKSKGGNGRRADPLPDKLHDGARNILLYRLAGTLRRCNTDPDAILAALRVQNVARCEPPLEDREVRDLAKGILRYAPAPELPRGWVKIGRELAVVTGLPGQEVLFATVAFHQAHGRNPKGQELADALGVSLSTVRREQKVAREAGIEPRRDPKERFVLVQGAALLDPAVTPSAKRVLLAVAAHADDRRAQIGIPALAEATGLCERHVRNATKALEAAGYLVADRAHYDPALGRLTRCNVYRLQLTAVPLAQTVTAQSETVGLPKVSPGASSPKSLPKVSPGASSPKPWGYAVRREAAVDALPARQHGGEGGAGAGGTKPARPRPATTRPTEAAHDPSSEPAQTADRPTADPRDLPDDRLQALVVEALDADRLRHTDPLYREWYARRTPKEATTDVQAAT